MAKRQIKFYFFMTMLRVLRWALIFVTRLCFLYSPKVVKMPTIFAQKIAKYNASQ